MRILLAILFWITFVGGLAMYMDSRERAETANAMIAPNPPATVTESYDLAITPSFNLVADPFALRADDGSEPAALTVRLGERELLRLTGQEQTDGIIRLESIEGLIDGVNEIYVEASPPMDDPFLFHAMRVRILQNERILAEKTLWARPGSKISGTLAFNTQATSSTSNEDSHDSH